MELLETYNQTIAALGALASLMLVQLLVADVVGLRAKHMPGDSVPADHGNLLFRTTRTVANTNESIAIFVLAVGFCLLSSASPQYTAYAAWTFVLARVVYAVFYYADVKLWRSVTFTVSLLALASLLVLGWMA